MAKVGKTDFVRILTKIRNTHDLSTDIKETIESYGDGYREMSGYCDLGWAMAINESEIVELLETMFDDTEGWISYFIYELNWGEDWEPGYVTGTDGNDIELSTIEQLYDFLVDDFSDVA